jgi:hypothetical protein
MRTNLRSPGSYEVSHDWVVTMCNGLEAPSGFRDVDCEPHYCNERVTSWWKCLECIPE